MARRSTMLGLGANIHAPSSQAPDCNRANDLANGRTPCSMSASFLLPTLTKNMNLDRVPAGRDLPNDFNVVIENPMRGDPIKYELDKTTGAMFVGRFMSTGCVREIAPARATCCRFCRRRGGIWATRPSICSARTPGSSPMRFSRPLRLMAPTTWWPPSRPQHYRRS